MRAAYEMRLTERDRRDGLLWECMNARQFLMLIVVGYMWHQVATTRVTLLFSMPHHNQPKIVPRFVR